MARSLNELVNIRKNDTGKKNLITCGEKKNFNIDKHSEIPTSVTSESQVEGKWHMD